MPALKHNRYMSLGKKDRADVAAAAALLRVADGLDRTHRRAVAGVSVVVARHCVQLHLVSSCNLIFEKQAAMKKSDLLASLLGKPIEII